MVNEIDSVNDTLIQQVDGLQQESAIAGFSIPYLPDFLADHTLLGRTPAENLTEVLERFERWSLACASTTTRHIPYASSPGLNLGL